MNSRITLAAACMLGLVLPDALFAQQAKSDADPLKLAADQKRSANNLKQIGLAFLSHHDAFTAFPRDITDKEGKPLLSWRVAVLPFLDQNELHEQFKLDQPWDSKANKKLLAMMPKVYLAPRGKFEAGHTFYQTYAGPGTVMSGKPTKISDVTDGLSYTVLAIEAGDAVPWTKPGGIPYDLTKSLPAAGGVFDGAYHVLFGDGSVRFFKKGLKETTLKKLVTIAGNEAIDEKELAP